MQHIATVSPEEAGQRLDLFCAAHVPALSRSAVQKAIKNGDITINDAVVKPKHVVRAGDIIRVAVIEKKVDEQPEVSPAAPTLSIPILYEDKDIIVVNKPAGVAVYQPEGVLAQATVASWFAKRYSALGQIGPHKARSGIIHRLDKDTSGVLILAKSEEALEIISQQFQRRHVRKQYIALVFGVPGMSDGRINRALGRSKRNPMRRTIDPEGKEAITEWKVEEKYGEDFTLMRVFPLTGRMHQIRAHLHFINHPIVGDTLYAFKRQRPPKGVTHQLLHAEKISFKLLNGERKIFVAPLPADFEHVLEKLRDDLREKNSRPRSR